MKTNLFKFPYLGGIFFIILFSWISFFPLPILGKYYFYTNSFLVLAFVALFISKRFSGFRLNDWPLWFFLTAIGVNVIFAQQKNIALKTYLDLFIPMFFIYYLISDGFSSQKRFDLLAKTVCLCSILVSLLGVFEAIFGYNPLYEHFIKNPYYLLKHVSGFTQVRSTQFDATAFGGYLLGCLPFNYFLFKGKERIFRLLGAAGIVLNTSLLISTFSCSALLGLVVMIAFYLLVQRKYGSIAILVGILFIFIFIFSFLPPPYSKFGIGGIIKGKIAYSYSPGKTQMIQQALKDYPDIEPAIHRADPSYGVGSGGGLLSPYRSKRLIMALRMVKDHPFSGVGFQHFRIRFYEYYPDKQKIPYNVMIADNMYLTILAETGLIGFLGFAVFIFSLLAKGWKQIVILNSASDKRLRLLVSLMALIGLLVDMAGFEFLYWPNQNLIFCVVIGCVGASLRKEVGSKK